MNTRKISKILSAEIRKSCIEKTNKIVVGDTYFLSSFYDKDGAFVEVLSKSTEKNDAGWNSSVEIKILESVGDNVLAPSFYAIGKIHTVNAANLYKTRELASHKIQFPSFY